MTQLHRLSSAFVKSAPHGKHSDGQGLWLIKRSDGGAQWVLRISLGGKRREMGLGSANDVSLKEARELASEYRKLAKHGRKMADTENYPASRDVVEKSQWRTAFLKIRIDSDVKEASVKKDFERQSQKLQEDGFIHSYEDKVWIVHDEDRQDI